MEVLRERASAGKAVVSHEAEVAESKVFAPTAGVVSTGIAHVGQSLTAGTSIAESSARPIRLSIGTSPMNV
ncbi:hypothetical protein HYH07_06715 [Bradyrhizobium sp. BR 10261]|nr:hypothetical protein [Bradyrhizobium sp. BR 10261]